MENYSTLKTALGRNKRHGSAQSQIRGSWSNNSFFTLVGFSLLTVFMAFQLAQPIRANEADKNTKEALPFLFETFEGLTFQSMPVGWTGNFQAYDFGGFNSAYRLTRWMQVPNQNNFWQTPEVAVGEGFFFKFMYRVVNQSGYPDVATAADKFSLTFEISTDGGTLFSPVTVINGHVPSNQYQQAELDLQAYEGQNIIVKVTARHTGVFGDSFWVDFDDVLIGNFSELNFLVEDTSGAPLEGAIITVPTLGTTTTGPTGIASIMAPDGTYTYTVSKTNYLSFSGEPVTVAGESVTLPAIALIGNFPATFSVRNQDDVAVSSAIVSITGQADSYQGSEPFSATVTTNTSGIAARAIPEGSYTYTVTRTDHYPSAPSDFTMTNTALSVDVSLQAYPLVSFLIEDTSGNPLQGATVTIEGYAPLTTNVSGVASKRLSIGSYTYTGYLIGYLENESPFTITENNNIALPAMALSEAPPTLNFITDVSEGITFRKTLTGTASATQTITFNNIGADPIVINPADIYISGPDADQFVFDPIGAPIELNTADQGSVVLHFTPNSAGLKTASLNIEDNTTGKILNTVALAGLGYEALAVPFYEDFNSGTFQQWVVVNGTQFNQWHVGLANGTDVLSAIVSNDDGLTNTYQTDGVGVTSVSHFYMDFDFPDAAEGDIILTIRWKGMGETNLDLLRVFNAPTSYLPAAGVIPSGTGISILGSFFMQNDWQTSNIIIPVGSLNQTRRLVFSWLNNGNSGTQPPTAIDYIYIGASYTLTTATNPTDAGTVTGAGEYGGMMPVSLTATANPGYTFTHWSAPAGTFADATNPETTFTMPGEDVTVTANFTFAGPAVADVTETYDGTEHSLAAGVPDGVDVIWYEAETGGEPIDVPASVDVAVITAWAAAIENGAESMRTQATLTVLPREVTATADDKDKVFGADDPDLTFTLTEGTLVEGDLFSGILTRETGEEVGTYAIQQGTLALSDNYDLTFVEGELEIMALPITITADAKTKVYGTDDPDLTWQITDGALLGTDAVTGDLTREPGEDVGEYEIQQGTLAITDNYAITFVLANLSITPAAITVTADNASKVYGDDDPEFTWAVTTGSLVGDDELTGALDRDAGEDVDDYTITQGTLSGGDNYLITFETGTLTITTRPITVAADDVSKEVGTADPPLTYSITAGTLAFTDAFEGALEREPGEELGPYDILQGTLALTANYDLTFVPGVFTIVQSIIPITITADAQSKVYGEDDPAFTWELTFGELLEGDEITGEPGRELGEDVGIYAIGQGTLTAGPQYAITFVPADLTIIPRGITVVADDKTKEQGTADPELTYTITEGELVFDDAFTGELEREAGEEVGTYAILQGTLALSDNYNMTFVPGVFTIFVDVVTVTVTADAQSKVYGEDDPALTYTVTPVEMAAELVFTGELTRVPGEDVSVYEIQQGTLSAGDNVVINYIPADFTITQRPLTITAQWATKVYGADDPVFLFDLTDGSLVFGDAFTGDLTREPGEDVGTYEILPGTLTAGNNYDITYVSGSLLITPLEVTIGGSFTAADKVYDGTTAATIADNQLVLVTPIAGDDVTLAGLVAVFASADPGEDITVSLVSAQLAGDDADNYELNIAGAPTTTATIFEPTFALTLVVTPENSGTVSGDGSYEANTLVNLSANPNAGFEFVQWEDAAGAVLSTDINYQYLMPAEDVTLTAVFDVENFVADITALNISMYPNPAAEFVNIRSDVQMIRVSFNDLTGKVVHAVAPESDEVLIATSDLPSGIYFVRIETTEGMKVVRLVVGRN